jgi:hypothetical protein
VSTNTTVEQLRTHITSVLGTYSRRITEGVETAAEITVKEMVKRTKERRTTKFSKGLYARHIASQVGESSIHARSRIWYVKDPEYRLTHLINNGHALRDGGRYAGDQHVTKAAEQAEIDFMARVEEVIRNANN